MSTAEREGTEAGRKLEEETKALYEEMKRLQEATGKHQLNVGNYAGAMIDAAAAAEQMASKIEKNTKQLAMMKLEGKETTEEYQNLLQETATLKDAMADASAEVANMASDTSQLDAVLAGASARPAVLPHIPEQWSYLAKRAKMWKRLNVSCKRRLRWQPVYNNCKMQCKNNRH
jgi:chromosome segregation ATPase